MAEEEVQQVSENSKKKWIWISLVALVIILIGIMGYLYFNNDSDSDIPYYFIAIHNEPYSQSNFSLEYPILQQMIALADSYDIKLTLMFTAQWADYISSSSERMAELEKWKAKGHEIAAHHHGIYHGAWDGYTGYTKEEAIAQRVKTGKTSEVYLGTLEDYISHLKKINPDINSGCVNDEASKIEMPDEIIYDTCSGYSNHLDVGERETDGQNPKKGINEYMLSGVVNGIERVWIAHNQIPTTSLEQASEETFSSLDSDNVYGIIVHSTSRELATFTEYLKFLHSQDSSGKYSMTLTEIITSRILPEEKLSSELASKIYLENPSYNPQTNASINVNKLCGDGICDAKEIADSNLCPLDCGVVVNGSVEVSTSSTDVSCIPNCIATGKTMAQCNAQCLCGDGLCDDIEKKNNICPVDCG